MRAHDETLEKERVFRRLLVNTLVTGVTSSFLWFALTFWVYLETRSVVATGVIGGAFSLSSAFLGPAFGTYVDHHRKHAAMVARHRQSRWSASPPPRSLFVAVDADDLLRLRSPWFWLLVALTLLGSVAGSMRGIALSTCVTLARARGPARPGQRPGRHGHRRVVRHHVGVQRARHRPARHGLGALRRARPHRRRARPPAHDPHRRTRPRADRRRAQPPRIDVRGAVEAIRAVPGLSMLIAPRRLQQPARRRVHGADGRLRPVARVGRDLGPRCSGVISLAFIAGGLLVAKFGLGPQPAAAAPRSATSSTGRCAPRSRCARRSSRWSSACSSGCC